MEEPVVFNPPLETYRSENRIEYTIGCSYLRYVSVRVNGGERDATVRDMEIWLVLEVQLTNRPSRHCFWEAGNSIVIDHSTFRMIKRKRFT